MTTPQTPLPHQPGPAPGPAPGAGLAGPAHSPPPPAAPPAARPRSGLLLVTLVVAVLALVVGLAGVVISAIALGRSDKAVTLVGGAAQPRDQQAPAAEPPPATGAATSDTTEAPTDAAADDSADPEVSASPGEIDPQAQFEIAYEGENLRIRSVGCQDWKKTYVDLDEPRILGEFPDRAEIGYSECMPGEIETGLASARIAGPNATPSDCLEAIRTDPARSPIAPTRGMTFCVVTSQNSAADQGIRQKLVFVTVNSITQDDGTGILNVTVKAWNVPQ